MKTKFILALSLVSFLLAGCSSKEPPHKPAPPATVNVPVETVALIQLPEQYEAVGTVAAKSTSILSSQIMGQVLAVHVQEGDRIKAGQVLIELDQRGLSAQTRKMESSVTEARQALNEVEKAIQAGESARTSAEVNRNLASSTYQRFQNLLERKSVSQQEFDEVSARYKMAQAEVARAEAMLESLRAKRSQTLARIEQARADVTSQHVSMSYSRISSPSAGLVTMKSVEVGSMAVPGMPLLKIEDSTVYRLEVAVEESRLRVLSLGVAVPVMIDALGIDPLSGKVSEIIPSADPASRSFIVKIDLPGNPSLRSGLFGKARIQTGQTQVMAVPRTALVEQGQLTGVYCLDQDGIARLRLVKTGKTYQDRIEVLSGLKAGDRIVTKDVERVTEGNRIGG